jgi:hypothetical protein
MCRRTGCGTPTVRTPSTGEHRFIWCKPRSATTPSRPRASTCMRGPKELQPPFWRSEKVEILFFLHLGARSLGAKDRYFAEPRMESSWFPPSTLPRVSSFPYLWVCSYTYGSVVIRILCGTYWFEVVNHHIMGKLQPELANGKGLLKRVHSTGKVCCQTQN